MTVAALRMVAMPLLEHDEPRTASLTDDRRDDGRSGDRRASDLRLIAADHQHVAERDFVLVSRTEDVALDLERLAFGDSILFSTGTNDGVHDNLRKKEPRLVAHPDRAAQRLEPRKTNRGRGLFRLSRSKEKAARRPPSKTNVVV